MNEHVKVDHLGRRLVPIATIRNSCYIIDSDGARTFCSFYHDGSCDDRDSQVFICAQRPVKNIWLEEVDAAAALLAGHQIRGFK